MVNHPQLKEHVKYPLFARLRDDYPHALELKFERVLRKIDELWDTDQIDAYFTSLVLDERGSRQGFPIDVLKDIIHLRDLRESERLLSARSNDERIWDLERTGIQFNVQLFLQAVHNGEQSLVDLFVRAGINLHAKDEAGTPAILIALKRGYTVIARILLDGGADPNARDRLGLMPLLVACGKPTLGFRNIAERLVKRGAEINVRDRLGLSPLLLSLSGGVPEMATVLIERGADISIRTREGYSALALAEMNGHHEVASLLRDRGARL